jgi:glycosyltransferase involved in cell wall biosynthesis
MHRIRTALPYFVAAGWEVTVLTVDDPTPAAPVEPELLATIPPAVRIVRARCWSRRWSGLFGIGNVALRSLPFLWAAGCRLLAGRRHDVVYFSTTMFITLPLGRVWKALHGVPYVIDLQDPWVSDYYDRPGAPPPPGGWKYRFARNLGRLLEGWTLRGASGLIAVSAAYLESARHRHPTLVGMPAAEIPFGSPDSDFAHLRATLAARHRLLPQVPGCRIVFAGALGPGQFAALDCLFAAVVAARREGAEISLHFFGTSYDPQARPATRELAARHGLLDCVHERPSRLRYFDALQVTLEADANLVLGSTDLAFTPSKILAVLAAGRPVLALAPAGSAMVGRLAAFDQSCATFSLPAPGQPEIAALARQLCDLAAGRRPTPAAGAWAQGSAAVVAARQLEMLAAA